MPAINTRGALSARGFGFAAPQGGGGYAYVAQYNYPYNFWYGGPSMASLTNLYNGNTVPTYLGGMGSMSGIIAAGSVIATPNGYSSNNGVTISQFQGNNSYQNTRTNPNTQIDVSSVSKTVVALGSLAGKGSPYNYAARWTFGSGGPVYVVANPTYSPWLQVIYWPRFDQFYLLTTQNSTVQILSGSVGALTGYTTGAFQVALSQPACVALNGDLYVAAYVNNYYENIYQVFNSDWSGYSLVGTNYFRVGYSSKPIYANGYWWKLYVNAGSLQMMQGSGGPFGWSPYSYIGLPLTPINKPVLMYDSVSSNFYASVLAQGSTKSGPYYNPYTYRSADASTWTFVGTYPAFAKNVLS